MKNDNLSRLPAFLIIVVLFHLLASCSPTPTQPVITTVPTETPAVVQTAVIAAAAASSTPTALPTATASPTTSIPSPFPLAGNWSGTAVNGDMQFEVMITIEESCMMGGDCGAFSIPIVPCSGIYVLAGEEKNVYEFEMKDKSPTCGEGIDYLQLQPDGTLKYISRGDYGVNEGILAKAGPDSSSITKLPVIFSDDGSPDGTTALLYLLSEPDADIKAVTISHGEARPKVYIQHMGRVLEEFGITGIPLGHGSDSALQPGEDFPEWLRQASDNFWSLPVPNKTKTYPTQDAAELMVSLLNQAPEPAAVFISGPSTDLALALRLDPNIREHISAVYIMGGAVTVPGNLTDFSANPSNVSAEWNIYVDPLAAAEVFSSGVPVVLVPLDATNQVSATMEDTRQWRAGLPPAQLAADMYDMLLGGSETAQMGLWDVMTAVIMVHPELCDLVPMNLEVITDYGDTYGQTLVLIEGEPNVQVCLEPDIQGIKQTLIDVFSGSR